MQNSQDNEKPKPTVRKAGGRRPSGTKAQRSVREPENKVAEPRRPQSESTSTPVRPMLTQEEYRARVAKRAFELYERRRALTELDDWLEAERLVKMHLLKEEQGEMGRRAG